MPIGHSNAMWQCKWLKLVGKFATNPSSANFSTHASGAIWWPNLELMQVEPPLVGEITQVQMLYPGSVVPLAMFFLAEFFIIFTCYMWFLSHLGPLHGQNWKNVSKKCFSACPRFWVPPGNGCVSEQMVDMTLRFKFFLGPNICWK